MMRFAMFVSFVLFTNVSFCSITICTWNLKDFGKSKSAKEIAFIANVLNQFDVVAIQEVVAGPGGSLAVARLVNELNAKGSKWDYSISEPTSGNSFNTEKYAYLWKSAKLTKMGKAWLQKEYDLEIAREPYCITLRSNAKSFTLVNFHAITKKMQPETEVKYFKLMPLSLPKQTLVFVGDFNLPQSHSVFNPLKKMGYQPLLTDQKTSMRQKCINSDCLSSEYDNMFFIRERCAVKKSGIISFFKGITDYNEARLISDHVPVYAEIELL